MEDEQGYIKFMVAIKDALLQRNGVVKVWMQEEETTDTLTFPTADEQEIAFLLQDTAPNQTAEYLSTKDGETRIKYTTKQRTLKVRNVNPRNVLYTENWDEYELQGIPFFAERVGMTRSELISMGFDAKEIDALPADPSDVYYTTRRSMREEGQGYAREMDEIQVYECYIQIDQDDDGVAELYKVYFANENVIGEFEPWPWVPYAMGTGLIFPHEIMGESLYDRLKQVQDSKTEALRQWHDNHKNANNTSTAINVNNVRVEDMTTARPARVIQVKGNPADNMFPMPMTDIGASSEALLNYQDKIRTERGGAALDMQQAEMQIVGDTAHGIERQYSSKELMVQMFGKTLAETIIRQVFLLAHQTMRVFSNEPLLVKIQGQWSQVNPADWPERTHVNVIVGQTAGQRNTAQQALMQFISMSMQLLQTPVAGQLVDLSGIYKAMQDWMKMAGVDNPESYMIDPTSPQAQQAAQQAQQQAQQQSEQQMQLYQQQRQDDLYKHDSELQHKFFDTALDAEVKEGEIISKAMIEAEKMTNEAKRTAEERLGNSTASNGGGN